MKIKKLEMENFKSFYGNATVEFADGLNVITGPNGSGKTNIIDAIKFIMNLKPLDENICVSHFALSGNVKVIFDEFEISCKIETNSSYEFNLPDFIKENEIKNYFEENAEFELYDADSFAALSKDDCKKFADKLKEKSKTTQIIVITFDKYLINLADKIIEVQKL